MAAARGMPIPPADEVPPELEYRLTSSNRSDEQQQQPEKNIKSLTVPIGPRSQSYNSDSSAHLSPANPAFSLPSPTSPLTSPSSTAGHLFRTRAKTLASLGTSSRNNSQTDMTPREVQLPSDPFVNGQPIEVYLYKDASECPICFLYYPPYLNTTRCCEQPICSECFVQIKRPDPHPPEHHEDGSQPAAPPTAIEGDAENEEGQLVSEPSTCPFCKMPEFGVTYAPPPFRRGLVHQGGTGAIARHASAMSSQSSISSANMSPGPGRRRGASLSATAPGVITTDRVRPDWATKLATARAHAARRSAAATALHTAAYLMGNNGRDQADPRTFTFGRRMRRTGSGEDSPGTSNAHLNALAFLAERAQQQQARQAAGQNESGANGGNPGLFMPPPPRGSSSRRSRVDDLEEMMMMEAIRLSLASEEERRKKEEKEAKKEAKKKEKAERKAEKSARKSSRTSLYHVSSNASSSGVLESNESFQGSPGFRATESATSLTGPEMANGKGKAVDRESTTASQPLNIPQPSSSTSQPLPIPGLSVSPTAGGGPTLSNTDPLKKSHLRNVSNVSSSASSLIDQIGTSVGTDAGFPSGLVSGSVSGNGTPPVGGTGDGGAGSEPMFNFRSLTETLIREEDDEEKTDGSGRGTHIEDVADGKLSANNLSLSDHSSKSAADGSEGPTETQRPTLHHDEEEEEDNPAASTDAAAAIMTGGSFNVDSSFPATTSNSLSSSVPYQTDQDESLEPTSKKSHPPCLPTKHDLTNHINTTTIPPPSEHQPPILTAKHAPTDTVSSTPSTTADATTTEHRQASPSPSSPS